jgi:aldose 1-epimerase
MIINKRSFGEINGDDVYEYTLKNDKGVEITCLNYGCAITKIVTPDRNGNCENIVLGFKDPSKYKENSPYFGVIVGRVAGRIKDAQFELEDQTYTLVKNNGNNHLHGGLKGFSNVVWAGKIIDTEQKAVVQFAYISRDGEQGYPGTLQMQVTYTLNNDNEFIIHYQGQSDNSTLLNPTNHTYFNLSGNLKRDILQHILKINSNHFLEVDEQLLPTGNLLDVGETVFDFRNGRQIIDGISSEHLQNKLVGQGYDHPFILNRNNKGEISLWEEESGRKLVVETDAVGVVLYTGNQLPDNLDIYGVTSRKYLGLCLETQGLPDAIHHTHFPSCILKKDQVFSTWTKYTFSVI